MDVVRKTVPSSGSGVTKAALSELGSAPRLGVGGGIGGSETRSIAFRPRTVKHKTEATAGHVSAITELLSAE